MVVATPMPWLEVVDLQIALTAAVSASVPIPFQNMTPSLVPFGLSAPTLPDHIFERCGGVGLCAGSSIFGINVRIG